MLEKAERMLKVGARQYFYAYLCTTVIVDGFGLIRILLLRSDRA